MNEDTIVAISTPIGVGGISIIRMSGDKAINISSQVFFMKNIKIDEIEPRKMYLGEFRAKTFTEKCMMVYFKAPFSYTGEDIVEFQCHGGYKITELILNELVCCGGVLASAGEFTKRAFLNGKISLDEAEGVIDVINAESESEIKAGYNLLNGNLKSKVKELQDKITDVVAKLEVALDYPEEDLEIETKQNLEQELSFVKSNLKQLLSSANTGKLLKNGTRVLILGKTNVGKSSLLNSLLNFDRAIVTSVQGTTRDVIEDTYLYNGARFVVLDTAGIRETADVVESIGINKAKELINTANIILFVVDGSEMLTNEDLDIYNSIKDKNTIVVVNKSDLTRKASLDIFDKNFIQSISTKDKMGINELKQKIFDMTIDKNIISSNIILTNARHVDAVKRALESTKTALNNLNNVALDLTALDIKNVWLILGEITGETNNEEIINTIFSKFCVGK